MDLDFHSMKRKQLQALCKKHKIPANLKNLEMADRLAALHKERENLVIEEVVEDVEEIEAKDVVLSKKSKKVRFSPDHELIEFIREPQVKRRTRRDSVYHNWSVEDDESSGREGIGAPVMVAGELKLVEAEVKQKNGGTKAVRSNVRKRGRVSVKDDEKKAEAEVKQKNGGTKAVRSNVRKRGRVSVKDDEKKASNNVKNKEQQEVVVQNRRRVTRSTAQKLTEAPVVEVKVARTSRKNKSAIAAPIAVTDDNGASGIGDSLISDVEMPIASPIAVTDDNGASGIGESLISDVEMPIAAPIAVTDDNGASGIGDSLISDVEMPIAAPIAVTDDNGASGIGESLISDVEVPIAAPIAVTDDNGASGIVESISGVQMPASKDSELTFITETHSTKEEFSVADIADSSCMNLINGDDLVNAANAVCKRAEAEVEESKLLLEVDVEESNKQNIADMKKDEPQAQVCSQLEDSGSVIIVNNQELAEGLDVGEEDPAEDSSYDQSILNADIKAAGSEVNESVQACGSDNNGEDTFQTCGKDAVFESCEADNTHPRSTSELKTPLSGMTKHHVDNVTEENGSFFHSGRASQQAEAEADSRSKDQIYDITPQVDSLVAEDDHGIDEEATADASISDIKSRSFIKIVTESIHDMKFQDKVESEGQHQNLLVMPTELGAGEGATHAISRQSWTETELQKLFGTSDEDSRGFETKNMTILKSKPTPSNSCSLAKEQEKEMDGESSNKCAEAKDNMVLPSQSDADIYEHGLNVLFATPVKNTTPCKIEETYFHEIVATESLSNEKAQNAGHHVENNLNVGVSLSDDGGDNICKGTDEVETFEFPNTSTRVLSGAVHESSEALEGQLVQNKEESLQETDSRREEDIEEHVIPLSESSLIDEAIENNVISTTGSPQDSNKIENWAGMSNVECDADVQMSGLSGDCLLDSSLDDNISREALAETSNVPEVAKITSSKKDATEKGMSPSFLSKATSDPDCEDLILESDDQCEAKILDEKDGTDELCTNIEVAVQETPFGFKRGQELDQVQPFDELENTSEEAKEMEMTTQILCDTDAAAELGSFVNGAAPVIGSDSGKVQDAGCELEKSVCSGDILPDGGGEDSCGKMSDVESIELKVTSTAVFSKTEHEVCEASEVLVEKETEFMTEDNEEKIISLGQSCLYNEEVDDDNLLTKENVNSLCGTPQNLDKLESSQAMLIDTSPSEGLRSESRVYHNKHEQVMPQSSEAAVELSDSGLLKSNSFNDSQNIIDEGKHEHGMPQSNEAAVELSDAGLLKRNVSKDSQNVIDEATYPLLSPKASPACDEHIQSTDTDDLDGAEICDKVDAQEKPSQEISVESYTNKEVTVESLLDCGNQSEEAGNTIASAATCPVHSPKASPSCDELIQSTDTDDLDRAEIRDKVDEEEKPSQSVESHINREVAAVESLFDCDNQCMEAGNIIASAECSTAQFSILDLHLEENAEGFENDTYAVSNLPASLKESDVDDTIKEYIESESSLSLIFESSSASLPGDTLANSDETLFARESSVMSKTETDLAASNAVPPADCLDAENKAREEAELTTIPAQVSDNAANPPEHVGFVDEAFYPGAIHKLASQEHIESTDLRSAMRKNARTILIHGTPSKLMTMADMKENEPNHKRSNVGDATVARPAKRRALSNLQQK